MYSASALSLVVGHKFAVIFSFQRHVTYVLPFVLGSKLHFHSTTLVLLMLYSVFALFMVQFFFSASCSCEMFIMVPQIFFKCCPDEMKL
jgi:hypothetical protein